MSKETVKVEGLKALQAALLELPKATGKNVVRRTLKSGAEMVADAARQKVPVESGHLRKTIGTGTKLTKHQRSRHKKKSEVEYFAGAGNDPAAHLQEFGSSQHGAQPFLRPAWDSTRYDVLDHIVKRLAEEIEKARKRLAAKTARLRAKGK
jgi:HK97 gp10 family phage protein